MIYTPPILLRYRFWINDFLNGSPIGKQYRDIKYVEEHSKKKGDAYRKEALRNLLEYSWDNSRFYKNYRNKYNLCQYPVMNKLTLIQDYDSIVVTPNLIPGQVGNVYIQKTSGSTGMPLAIPQDTRKKKRRIAEIKYFGKKLGFNSHEKLIHLRTWNQWQKKSLQQIRRENIIPFDIKRLGEDDLRKLCDLIVKEKALSLRGYASTFESICKVAAKYNYHFPSLKIIVSTSESLEDNVRASVKQIMKCEIASQYANEECGILAQERVPTLPTDNKMYFNWSGYYFEVLQLDSDNPAAYGEIGRIVLTDLHNYAFPLIRYDTGDTCVLLPPDKYSNGYPVMGKLYGRKFDLTYTTDGTPIYPLTYGRIMKNYPFILSWQFVQIAQKSYQLRLIQKFEDKISVNDIVANIKAIIGADANISIVKVNDIPTLKSGKRKPVANEWENNIL